MDKEFRDIQDLLRKYQDGTCTHEERRLIESWYAQYTTETTLDKEELYADLSLLKKRLDRINEDRSIRTSRLMKIAASILIIFSVGFSAYLYLTTGHPQTSISQDINDILPGGNRATLILEDGSQIDLNTADRTFLFEQAEGRIKNVTEGVIAYRKSDTHRAVERKTIYHTVTTPNGGQYKVVLPDGTSVWLNAASSLKYPVQFEDNQRIVFLKGEAYFEVEKDKDRPFIVSSEQQEVKVLGTHFNINAYRDDQFTYTTLLEGKVVVTPSSSNEQKVLAPGQQAKLSGKIVKLTNADVEQAMGWKSGYFIFRHTSLKAVLDQLSRWYDIQIDTSGPIPDEYFEGEVSRQSKLSEILSVLEMSSELKFKLEGRRLKIET